MRKNNFDLLRLALATWVCFQHSYLVGLEPLKVHFMGVVFNGYTAVQCFFVVSGFLIFQSWENSSTWRSYFSKRVRRIYPAYLTVVISMVVVGAWLTSLDLTSYLASDGLIKYLLANLTFLNFLQPTLPGVFTNAAESLVNGPLWTIKIEVMFYISVPIVALIAKRFGLIPVMCALYFASAVWAMTFAHLYETTGRGLYDMLGRQLPGQMTFFVAGGLLYYCFDTFEKYAHHLAVLAVVGLVAHSYFELQWLYPALISVVVIYFAVVCPYFGNFGRFGDMSYGLYIVHYPVLQIIATLGIFASSETALAVGFSSALILAWLSWHFVEKPALLKNSHYRIAEIVPDTTAKKGDTKVS